MPNIVKPTGSKKWLLWYTDQNGQRRKKTLMADRETSERIARDLLNKVALRKDGVVDERDEKFAEHEGTTLKDHLEDYSRAIRAQGATEKHIKAVTREIGYILGLAKIRRISDLSAARVQEALAAARKTKSTGTVNNYTQRVKSFNRWLCAERRAREYVLLGLKQKSAKNDRRRVRRRMTDDEVIRVISAAEIGPVWENLSGPDRAMLYRVAHGTGFRAKELRTLTTDRFRLNDSPPTITVLACYSKNKQEAVQPISTALADRLKPWLAPKRRGSVVFDGMSEKTARMLRYDLEAAGVPFETDDGVADFHASRGTFISNVVSSGASVKTCQTLARHADPSLTIGIYAKASLHDIHGAVEKLPDLAPVLPEAETMRATGTDGRSRATHGATRAENQEEAGDSNSLSIGTLHHDSTSDVSLRLQRGDDGRKTASQARYQHRYAGPGSPASR
jgi:integrase